MWAGVSMSSGFLLGGGAVLHRELFGLDHGHHAAAQLLDSGIIQVELGVVGVAAQAQTGAFGLGLLQDPAPQQGLVPVLLGDGLILLVLGRGEDRLGQGGADLAA